MVKTVAVCFVLLVYKVMWSLYVEYSRNALEHIYTMWETNLFRGIHL